MRGLHALAESHFYLGEGFYNARNFEGAMAELREAVSLKPDWPEARCALGTVLCLNGIPLLVPELCGSATPQGAQLLQAPYEENVAALVNTC